MARGNSSTHRITLDSIFDEHSKMRAAIDHDPVFMLMPEKLNREGASRVELRDEYGQKMDMDGQPAVVEYWSETHGFNRCAELFVEWSVPQDGIDSVRIATESNGKLQRYTVEYSKGPVRSQTFMYNPSVQGEVIGHQVVEVDPDHFGGVDGVSFDPTGEFDCPTAFRFRDPCFESGGSQSVAYLEFAPGDSDLRVAVRAGIREISDELKLRHYRKDTEDDVILYGVNWASNSGKLTKSRKVQAAQISQGKLILTLHMGSNQYPHFEKTFNENIRALNRSELLSGLPELIDLDELTQLEHVPSGLFD